MAIFVRHFLTCQLVLEGMAHSGVVGLSCIERLVVEQGSKIPALFPVLTSLDGLGWECVNKTNPTRAKDQSFWDFNPSCTVGLGSPPIFPTAAAWTPEVKEEIARSPGPEKRAPGTV